MRLVLSLLAVLAMLASPAIAKACCNEAVMAAPFSADMPGMARMSLVSRDQFAAPCGGKVTNQMPSPRKVCAQTCAAMASAAVVAMPADHGVVPTFTRARLAASPSDMLPSHEPGRLDPPPKLFA